jgi:AAA+ ATPase superfamily predicted ATPase
MFVGRKEELQRLRQQINRDEPSFVAIYGRRRIGKTLLVRELCRQDKIKLIEFTGQHKANTKTQLYSFSRRLKAHSLELSKIPIKNWPDAFDLLGVYLNNWSAHKPLVLFFDELPWLDSARSNFISALADFWGFHVSQHPNITLVICGSAASYMIKKVEHNQGPLHNRTTSILRMKAFDLHDTKLLIEARHWHLSDKSIVNVYLTFGGVAKYLTDIDTTLTFDQAIGQACFGTNALMVEEYTTLFSSLFDDAKAHYAIMNVLAQRWSGLTQQAISNATKFSNSTISDALEELFASGFVGKTRFFGNKTKKTLFCAVDFFSYFHHKWIAPKIVNDWSNIVGTQAYRSWAGFAFEKLCHIHEYQINRALGIQGIETAISYWSSAPQTSADNGAQIDMLIKHLNGSNSVEIVECKYYDGEFTITKEYKNMLLNKRLVFDNQTGNKYNCRFSIVTPFGVKKNDHFNELNPKVITLEDLFSQKA